MLFTRWKQKVEVVQFMTSDFCDRYLCQFQCSSMQMIGTFKRYLCSDPFWTPKCCSLQALQGQNSRCGGAVLDTNACKERTAPR